MLAAVAAASRIPATAAPLACTVRVRRVVYCQPVATPWLLPIVVGAGVRRLSAGCDQAAAGAATAATSTAILAILPIRPPRGAGLISVYRRRRRRARRAG